MPAAVNRVIVDIRAGKRAPVYLLHGDEFLTRQGAKELVDALVPPDRQPLSVELLSEGQELVSLSARLRTVSLFGGTKVVVVHDSKAFVTKQNLGKLFERSREAWQADDLERSVRAFLQAVAAAGQGAAFVEQSARGELSDEAWEGLLRMTRDPEGEAWLREVAGRAVRDALPVPEASGAPSARVYEDLLAQGLPAESVLVLTCEVVDERRALFKAIREKGAVIDCSVGPKKDYSTQMNPEAARAKIRETIAAAGKTIDREAGQYILERTGLSMRALASELEKLVLFVGSRAKIDLADVTQVLSESREAGVFDLTNALCARDAGKGLRALRSLLAQREPAVMIVGLLAAEVRRLILARSLLDERLGGQFDTGMTYAAFQARLLPRLQAEDAKAKTDEERSGPKTPLPGIHPFRLFNLFRTAAAFSQERLLHAMEEIAEADLALKTSGQPEALLLEQVLLSICATPGANGRRE